MLFWCLVGSVIGTRCPNNEDRLILVNYRVLRRLIPRIDLIALPRDFSLNLIDIEIAEASWGQDWMTLLVRFNSDDDISPAKV
jgi:hypothetical protein